MNGILNLQSIEEQIVNFGNSGPFDHVVIENFFNDDFAKYLAQDFPDFESEIWHQYSNAIEIKKHVTTGMFLPKKLIRHLRT